MRLWHKDLINYLPSKQLMALWRECCAIAKSIMMEGKPNHLLINKVMDYSLDQFYTYGINVYIAMKNRGYKCDLRKFSKYFTDRQKNIVNEPIFIDWHNERYLMQNYYNLQEKFDCGGIPENEWKVFRDKYFELIEG